MLAALFASAGLIGAVPAAALACNPMRTQNGGTWLGGRALDITNGNWWSWVEADLEVQDPYVITSLGTNSSSYAWVMMSPEGMALTHWAQVGPYKDGYNGRADLWECYDGSTPDNELWPAHSLGSTPTYRIDYGANGWKYFSINGTSKGSCPYSFTPSEADAASEIGNEGTQVPGSVSNHEGFTNAVGEGSGGSMHDLFDSSSDLLYSTPSGGTLPSWFNVYLAADTHLETWDGACS